LPLGARAARPPKRPPLDARVALGQVVGGGVGLEEQTLQLQHGCGAVGLRDVVALGAGELALLELVLQVRHAHGDQLGVSRRQHEPLKLLLRLRLGGALGALLLEPRVNPPSRMEFRSLPPASSPSSASSSR